MAVLHFNPFRISMLLVPGSRTGGPGLSRPARPASLLPISLAALVAAAAPLHGQFALTSASTTAQTLSAAGATGTVSSTGSLTLTGSTVAVTMNGNNTTLDNGGVVAQNGTGRAVRFTGSALINVTVLNRAGARISAAAGDAIQANNANARITLTNAGLIQASGNQALDFADASSAVILNEATGQILATGQDAIRPGAGASVTNFGTIAATPVRDTSESGNVIDGNDGIDARDGSGVTIHNHGSIHGRHGITGNDSPLNTYAIAVTNHSGGTIHGVNGSGINIDGVAPGVVATIVNQAGGTISGTYDVAGAWDAGDGDGVDVDGIVHLTNAGTIAGLGAYGSNDGEANGADGVAAGGGTIVNAAGGLIYGRIDAGDPSAAANGILINDSAGGAAVAATTIENAGTIRGYQGFAVRLVGDFADTITNDAGGLLQGGGAGAAVRMGGGHDVLTNAGTIAHDGGAAAWAVALEAGDDRLVLRGEDARINGGIDGSDGVDTLDVDLAPGGHARIEGAIANFESLQLNAGTLTLVNSTVTAAPGAVFEVAAGATLAVTGSWHLAQTDLVFAPGATLALGLVEGALQEHALVTLDGGSLELTGADLVLTLSGTSVVGATYTLFDVVNGGTLTGEFAGLSEGAVFSVGSSWFAISYAGGSGSSVVLTQVSAVPEPGTYAALAGAAVLALAGWRRRRARGMTRA